MDLKIKEKINDTEINPYKIFGICNPGFAYKALQAEENIGLFLHCKIFVKNPGDGNIVYHVRITRVADFTIFNTLTAG